MENVLSNPAPDKLLSVVIPNHNYGRFVGEAIASVAAQGYGPIQLIVVDDADRKSVV